MKAYHTIYFLFLVTISLAQQDQNQWKSELDFGNGFSISTFFKVENTHNQYVITSPNNADVRMFGGLKARLGRLSKKIPKKGVFININAVQKGDSLFGNTKLPVFGKLKFSGILTENLLSGEFSKNDTIVIGTLTGLKSSENRINYSYLYPKILKITHENIFSTKVLETKEWKKFQKNIKNLCKNAQDDIEFFLGFNILSSKLPFSHYNFYIEVENNANKIQVSEPSVFFKEKNCKTAYLQIKNFSTSQKELAEILPIIVKKNYQNLIVDLRNNGGGTIEPAFEFAKHITNKHTKIGYFVSNKLQHTGFQPKLFETLPEANPQTIVEFVENVKTGKGAKLIFKKPKHSVFSGNLYILTNNKTASTCEPIVYVLKKSKRATIIGEKTAGAMLSAAPYEIFGKYKLNLAISDFYTYDGVRLEGVGVVPDIETTSEKALEKALELISKNKKN